MASQTFGWKNWNLFLCLLSTLITACVPTTPSAQDYAICTPIATDANPYMYPTPTTLNSIYQFAIDANQTVFNVNGNKTNAQYHALTLLKEQVRRWSSFQDIPVNNRSQIIRITITYLDPELLQVILLNELLTQAFPISIDDFNSKLRDGLRDVAKRDELMFLVTITSSLYDTSAFGENLVSINIPIREMRMINSSDIAPKPKHDDHPLDQTINISHKWMSGYLAYPIAVQVNGNCHQVMAPQWNTTMIISLSSVEINGEKYDHQLSWTVKYHPLLNLDTSSVTSAPSIPTGFEMARLSYSTTPPTPEVGRTPTDENYWNLYWEDMARYVWAYVIDP